MWCRKLVQVISYIDHVKTRLRFFKDVCFLYWVHSPSFHLQCLTLSKRREVKESLFILNKKYCTKVDVGNSTRYGKNILNSRQRIYKFPLVKPNFLQLNCFIMLQFVFLLQVKMYEIHYIISNNFYKRFEKLNHVSIRLILYMRKLSLYFCHM